jgi:hypothetical protein
VPVNEHLFLSSFEIIEVRVINKCGNSFFLRFTVCSELRIKPGIKGGEAESLVSQGFESRKTVIISLVAI